MDVSVYVKKRVVCSRSRTVAMNVVRRKFPNAKLITSEVVGDRCIVVWFVVDSNVLKSVI